MLDKKYIYHALKFEFYLHFQNFSVFILVISVTFIIFAVLFRTYSMI